MLLVEPERGDEHAGHHGESKVRSLAPMLALHLVDDAEARGEHDAAAATTSRAPTARSRSAPRNTMP